VAKIHIPGDFPSAPTYSDGERVFLSPRSPLSVAKSGAPYLVANHLRVAESISDILMALLYFLQNSSKARSVTNVSLSDHFKSGQRLSVQNRPMEDAEEVNVLSCQEPLRQVEFEW
jgi:hypothetical protein